MTTKNMTFTLIGWPTSNIIITLLTIANINETKKGRPS